MSRHQGTDRRGKPSGRGNNGGQSQRAARGGKYMQSESFARGNAPIRKKTVQPKHRSETDEIRLNKYIANSGICSRREADENIALGLVTVNGKIVTEMGYKVKLEDDVRFDGARINPEKKAYVLLNKPKGFASSSEDKGRTVMDLVANATSSRIKPIGRLGRNAVGLILLTNDETIAQKFKHSKNGIARLFHIELDKNLKYEDFEAIKKGLQIEGNQVLIEEISYIEGAPKKEIGLKLKHTGNNVIRMIFGHLKYEILRLDCVAIGHLTKKDLPRGRWRHLTPQEINTLKML